MATVDTIFLADKPVSYLVDENSYFMAAPFFRDKKS